METTIKKTKLIQRSSKAPSTPINSKEKKIQHIIPGSLDSRSLNHVVITSGTAAQLAELQNETWNEVEAKELYSFLVTHTPAGIYEELMKLMIHEDLKCNNYYSKLLGEDPKKIQSKARREGLI